MVNQNYRVLVLDQGGLPKEWVTPRDAVFYHATEKVSWELGLDELDITFNGGVNRISGVQSQIKTAPIIAIKNDNTGQLRMSKPPSISNRILFRRDGFRCAYCGQQYKSHSLTRDHIHPVSRGGKDIWGNIITACKDCNNYKDNKLLTELDLHLRFQPYTPSYAEVMMYENACMIKCQIDYLSEFVTKGSRIEEYLTTIYGGKT